MPFLHWLWRVRSESLVSCAVFIHIIFFNMSLRDSKLCMNSFGGKFHKPNQFHLQYYNWNHWTDWLCLKLLVCLVFNCLCVRCSNNAVSCETQRNCGTADVCSKNWEYRPHSHTINWFLLVFFSEQIKPKTSMWKFCWQTERFGNIFNPHIGCGMHIAYAAKFTNFIISHLYIIQKCSCNWVLAAIYAKHMKITILFYGCNMSKSTFAARNTPEPREESLVLQMAVVVAICSNTYKLT